MTKRELWRFCHPMRTHLVAIIHETERGFLEVEIGREVHKKDGSGSFIAANISDWELQLVPSLVQRVQNALIRLIGERPAVAKPETRQVAPPRPMPQNTTVAMEKVSFEDDII